MKAVALTARLSALGEVRNLGRGCLDPQVGSAIDDLLERARDRRSRSSEHTVVGLFGATGSGKSSLLNGIVGEDIAVAHIKRPTTSEPLAVLWDAAGASELLDWLDVHERHTLTVPIDPGAAELILLDLPDFDSLEPRHRAIAERLAAQVDGLLWVVDPQKYADAVLHRDFLTQHSRHGAVTIVVLNQVDLLRSSDTMAVVTSLKQALKSDGLGNVHVLAASARTGAGLGELRAAVGNLAASREAQEARLLADVLTIADRIEPSDAGAAPGAPQLATLARAMESKIAFAAGVETVARAVGRSYRKRATQAAGWPPLAWLSRLRADPLGRLGLLAKPANRRDPALHRTSLPPLSSAAEAQISIAVRDFTDKVASGLKDPWRAHVDREVADAQYRLPAELDLAIGSTKLPAGGSWWWPCLAVIQWIATVTALVGLLWTVVRILLPGIDTLIPTSWPGGWPLPILLIVVGLALGAILTLVASLASIVTAAARRRGARRVLLKNLSHVAHSVIVEPVTTVLDRAAEFDRYLKMVGGTR